MKLSLLLPLVLAVAVDTATARQSALDNAARKHVVLQVEQEPDYSATDIVRMLGMNSYLGAITPSLATDWSVLGEGRVVVSAQLASQEVVALTFYGERQEDLTTASQKLLAHLSSLMPTRRRTMQASLARAELDLQTANEAVAAVDREVAQFRDRHGGDVVNVLSEVQVVLRQHRSELTTIEDRLAVETATRDYLREAIRSRNDLGDGSGGSIEAEVAKLRGDLAAAKEKYLPTHPEVVKLESRLQDLDAKIAASVGARAQSSGLEMRLFSVEEEVFGLERRREWLKTQLAEKWEIERSLSRVRDEWRSLESKVQQAQMRLNEARGALEILRRDFARMPQGEWIRVIAG